MCRAGTGTSRSARLRSTCSSTRLWTSSSPWSPSADVLAAAGAFIFVAIAVKSVFFGEPLGTIVRGVAMEGVPRGLTHPPVHAADVDARNAALHDVSRGIMGPAPGTIVLVFVFLAAFILYFFVNWKMSVVPLEDRVSETGRARAAVTALAADPGDHGVVVGARAVAGRGRRRLVAPAHTRGVLRIDAQRYAAERGWLAAARWTTDRHARRCWQRCGPASWRGIRTGDEPRFGQLDRRPRCRRPRRRSGGAWPSRVAARDETVRFRPGRTRTSRRSSRASMTMPHPRLPLIDQRGPSRSRWMSFADGPVLVTFAYAHCETICPLVVGRLLLAAQRQLTDARLRSWSITLDPWRDTPSRLKTIATSWTWDPEAHLLSGPPEAVERALNAWRVPRVRNEKTGDLSHPAIVYVVGTDGRIAYVVQGNAAAIVAAVRAL